MQPLGLPRRAVTKSHSQLQHPRNRSQPGDLTFSEARDFLTNAGSRLSAEEAQRLTPTARHFLSDFYSELNSAIRDTAQNAGVLDDYASAVNEYRQATNLNDAWQVTKELGGKALGKIATGAGLGAAYAVARKYLP